MGQLEELERSEMLAERRTQEKVEGLDEETQELFAEFRRLAFEIDEAERLLPGLRERAEELGGAFAQTKSEVAALQGAESVLLQFHSAMKQDLESLGVKTNDNAPISETRSLGEELSSLLEAGRELYESAGKIAVTEKAFVTSEKTVVFDRVNVGRLASYAVSKDRTSGFRIAADETLGAELSPGELALIQELLSPRGSRRVVLPATSVSSNTEASQLRDQE